MRSVEDSETLARSNDLQQIMNMMEDVTDSSGMERNIKKIKLKMLLRSGCENLRE